MFFVIMIVCVSVNVVNVFSTMLILCSIGLDLKVDQDLNPAILCQLGSTCNFQSLFSTAFLLTT